VEEDMHASKPAVLALVALLASSASAVSPPSSEPGNSGEKKPITMKKSVTVMTRNLYLGGDISLPLSATSLADALASAGYAWQTVVATDFPRRARALAEEIATVHPDLIGLQEVGLWRVEAPSDEVALVGGELVPVDGFAPDATQVAYDFLAILLDALAARGLEYEVASAVQNADLELPVPTSLEPLTLMDVRYTDHDVILARADRPGLHTFNPQGANFDASLAVTIANVIPVKVARGWTSVDVTIDTKGAEETFRFFNSHPEAFSDQVTFAQVTELAGLVAQSPYPVILAGDLNTGPDVVPQAYALITSILTDAWAARHGEAGGLTCCQLATLTNADSLLGSRIDHVLYDGPFKARSVDVVGEVPVDPPLELAVDLPAFGPFPVLPAGTPMYWASDHAGVAAELRIKKEKHAELRQR
jgi:endonuclease/exonuclease/phosphatase family metal-dependent hydrolase